MNFLKIFVVEDDPWYGQLMHYNLSLNPDFQVKLITNAKECLSRLHENPDVICIDFTLPDMMGDELLKKIHEVNREIPVLIISGQEQIDIAVQLIKLGASDYMIKNDNTKEMIWNALLKINERRKLSKQVELLKDQLEHKFAFDKTIIGQSPALKNTLLLIEKAILSNINVSIYGETGTGKEVVAKAIHFNSERRRKPFVSVNMAAIPSELMESELFGHEKGAFTGAVGRRTGKFEEAQGGTLFLDEIGELDINLQAKLLRVLQEREVVRVGGNEKISLDIRVITASHRKLAEQVKKGLFREDLYYRVLGLPIDLPPLRERGNDILLLAKHFISEFSKNNSCAPVSLNEASREKLIRYNYPGNVRELKAMIDLAFVMCNGREIMPEDITFPSVRYDTMITQDKTLEEHNRDIIHFYLKKYGNNVVLVAGKLGIGKSTIYNMLKKKESVTAV